MRRRALAEELDGAVLMPDVEDALDLGQWVAFDVLSGVEGFQSQLGLDHQGHHVAGTGQMG